MGETMRDAFGKYLAKLGNYRDDLVVLDADVSSSTKSSYFAKAFPNRFFNVGVAESNMVDIAGGLATAGLRPVVNAFAIFLSLKATDQIRNVLAYNRLPVVLVGAYGGLSDSFDGASHQSLEDIAIMRSIPGLEVIIPADSSEALRALEYALEQDCPVYIRLNRNQIPDLEARSDDEPLTRIRALRSGCDVTIAASGICVSIALKAAEILADYRGARCRLDKALRHQYTLGIGCQNRSLGYCRRAQHYGRPRKCVCRSIGRERHCISSSSHWSKGLLHRVRALRNTFGKIWHQC